MVEKTLRAMRRSGIYDHIGYGFHRYSTDARWLVPHFEKMLYDQALLAMAYIETFQATRKEEYARTAREIFTYVLRDMTAKEGGFYSAEDADSEGEEGKFYLWTHDEIKRVLITEEADLFIKLFNIQKGGNFGDEATGSKTGRNIPHLTESLEETDAELNVSVTELQKSLESIREKLFSHRDKRLHPHKDDKILTDWNGLMVAALARGARALDEPVYASAAKRGLDFILGNMLTSDGRLFHRYRDGEAAVSGHLDDYAFLIHGLLELYETTFEVDFLKKAIGLNEHLMEHFWDDKNGGFYFTADDGEVLLVRQKEIYDGAIPSGNSIAMMNLLRLGRVTANSSLEEKATRIGRTFFENVRQLPSAYTQLMMAVDFAVGPSSELIVTGDPQADDTRKMLQAIQQVFIPNKIVIFLPATPDSLDIKTVAPFTADYSSIDGKATAYVCVNYGCNLPTTDANTFLVLLRSI
jgi:uncharacterized protein YyaL (SSP411 family)